LLETTHATRWLESSRRKVSDILQNKFALQKTSPRNLHI